MKISIFAKMLTLKGCCTYSREKWSLLNLVKIRVYWLVLSLVNLIFLNISNDLAPNSWLWAFCSYYIYDTTNADLNLIFFN